MENVLQNRNNDGVSDAILLEDYQNEDAFIDNLRKRYDVESVYTYIGQVLVSVNPYKFLKIYGNDQMEKYRKANFYELPPHTYAIADNAYRTAVVENRNTCILISGESGAGKTESSKHVLEFIAASSRHKKVGDEIRDKLLKSNPLLEAFGNARTNRNDNSSRFGKYMTIEFDFKGDAVGGKIKNYLLEKSRFFYHNVGERNFHVFYYLLAGASEETLGKFHLKRNISEYFYLKQGISEEIETSIKDINSYKHIQDAFSVLGFSENEQSTAWSLVASILHLGNINFTSNSYGNEVCSSREEVKIISKLLGCDEDELLKALTYKTIEANNEVLNTPFTAEQAISTRDALSKSIYERMFNWLIDKLNKSLQPPEDNKGNRIGILDIYGFEVFQKNGFEQFCINYCNEKLQQVFIELTLRSEQEEYLKEGIDWQEIEYFDNKIICDLIEKRHGGIISLMDEECLRPGNATDLTLLNKMNEAFIGHRHFTSYDNANYNTLKKSFKKEDFRLRHYAGDVTYHIAGFLEKNKDLMFRSVKEVLARSKNFIISSLFQKDDISELKRPDSAATQFKTSLGQLMSSLMLMEPFYIRCIKPNDFQSPNNFDVERVRHQVQYLGLMENVRVRRAGFAYRRKYNYFLQRYKSLCPKTWPFYKGPAKKGVELILEELKYANEEYRLGETKLFIRLPQTLFRTEDAFQAKKHELASFLQSRWKGKKQREKYLKMIEAVTVISKHWRRILAQRLKIKRKLASIVIRRFVQDYITRNDEGSINNVKFQSLVIYRWLLKLSQNLPKSLIHHQFPDHPKSCAEASKILEDIHRRYLARKYVKSMKMETKSKFLEKIKAEELFKGKKVSYGDIFPYWFKTSRLSPDEDKLCKLYFQQVSKEWLLYCTTCLKFNRKNYKPKYRLFVLTCKHIYILEVRERKLRAKEKYPLRVIESLFVSPNSDGFLLIQVAREEAHKDRGDLILSMSNVIEGVTKIVLATKKMDLLKIVDSEMMKHTKKKGKQGTVLLTKGPSPSINRNKEGQLVVVGC